MTLQKCDTQYNLSVESIVWSPNEKVYESKMRIEEFNFRHTYSFAIRVIATS